MAPLDETYANGVASLDAPHRDAGVHARLLSDEDYAALQAVLVKRPTAGDKIPGSGGLRKIRWNASGQGKRGGIRVIYYWHVPDAIYLLYPFKKNEVEDLTKDQIKQLARLVKEWLR